jgi:hypothetical protein
VTLRAAEDTLTFAVEETLDTLQLSDEDAGLCRLATTYAAAIDANAEALSDLGPKLLAALEALGASPRARAAMVRRQGPGVTTELEKLRDARRSRKG